MATHATTITRPGESLTVVPVTQKSRNFFPEHAKLPPLINFIATHYVGSKVVPHDDVDNPLKLTAPNLGGAVALARFRLGWMED
jgi:hypothetical protein